MPEFYMFLARKIITIPEFLLYLPEKLTKFPNFTWFLPENARILHKNCRKKFSPEFQGHVSPVSYAYGAVSEDDDDDDDDICFVLDIM